MPRASVTAAVPQDYGLLRSKTDSDERWAPITALKAQAPELARARFYLCVTCRYTECRP
jgi:hypothetical protein